MWVYQSNVLSLDNSVELKWTPEPWTPDEECSKGYKRKFISTLNFPGEEYKAVDLTLDNEEILLKKLELVLDKLLTKEYKQLNFDNFQSEIIQDEALLPDLQV